MTHPPQQPLDELQALIDKATPGPWHYGADFGPLDDESRANAHLIALAPQLAAENISLHQEIQRLREALDQARGGLAGAQVLIKAMSGRDSIALETAIERIDAALSSQENSDDR